MLLNRNGISRLFKVVTIMGSNFRASVDSTDAFGYTDYTVGWFNEECDIVIETGKIISDWWTYQYDTWGHVGPTCMGVFIFQWQGI